MISQLTRYNYFIIVFIIKIIVITFNIAHISVTNIHKQICIHTYTYKIKYVQANIMFKNTILCTHKHTSAWTQKHLRKHMYLYTCTYTQIINAHKKRFLEITFLVSGGFKIMNFVSDDNEIMNVSRDLGKTNFVCQENEPPKSWFRNNDLRKLWSQDNEFCKSWSWDNELFKSWSRGNELIKSRPR